MPLQSLQIPWVILPQGAILGTETEIVADVVTHVSVDLPVEFIQEKEIHVLATEVVVAGVPGNLWVWVELSPYPSTISTIYFAAIGGGGGALAPMVPLLEVATGINLTDHTILLPWSIHSPVARVVVQTPIAAALPNAFWVVQVLVTGKTP